MMQFAPADEPYDQKEVVPLCSRAVMHVPQSLAQSVERRIRGQIILLYLPAFFSYACAHAHREKTGVQAAFGGGKLVLNRDSAC
jgi:hypothetical protein